MGPLWQTSHPSSLLMVCPLMQSNGLDIKSSWKPSHFSTLWRRRASMCSSWTCEAPITVINTQNWIPQLTTNTGNSTRVSWATMMCQPLLRSPRKSQDGTRSSTWATHKGQLNFCTVLPIAASTTRRIWSRTLGWHHALSLISQTVTSWLNWP